MNNTISQKIIQQNKETYNKIATNFSNTRDRQWADFENFKANYTKTGDTVLDIGCGNGRVYELLQDKNINYFGLDISSGLITEAQKKYPKANFQIGDILELNYQNRFDVIFCVAVLNHLPSTEVQTQALQNIYQALKPGGCLLMTNWNMWNITNKKSWWRVRSKADLRNVITYWGQEKLPLYYYAFTKRGLKKLLTKAGFNVVENQYSLDGKKVGWWRAKNIVSVAQKK